MASIKAADPANPSSTLSGKRVTVEFLKTQDQEPRDIFVAVNEYQAVIKRGTPVPIPVEAFEAIKGATYTDMEDDPEFPGRKVPVEKLRFPYNIVSYNA